MASVSISQAPNASRIGLHKYSANVNVITATSAGLSTTTYTQDAMNAGKLPQNLCSVLKESMK